MAQAQIQDFNIMSVENIRMLIMNHSYEVEKNKKLYQERLAARQEMQKNIDLVKNFLFTLYCAKLWSHGQMKLWCQVHC